MLAYQPVKTLTKVNVAIGQGLAAAKRILPIVDLKVEIESNENSERLKLKSRTERKGQPGRDDLAFNSAIGFKIEKTSLLSLELNNAI